MNKKIRNAQLAQYNFILGKLRNIIWTVWYDIFPFITKFKALSSSLINCQSYK
jgi:hypothetical protein